MSKTVHIPFLMVTDARIGTNLHGDAATLDRALAYGGWRRGLTHLKGLEYAARLDARLGSGTLPLVGTVHPLPYYQGLKGMLVCVFPMLLQVIRLVRRSDVVVTRLPGFIGLLSCFTANVLRKPLAVEVVGDIEAVVSGTHAGTPRRVAGAFARFITGRALRAAQTVRYVTESSLQEKYPPSRRAATIAFSSVRLDGWDDNARAENTDYPSIIAVGSQEQSYKGHDLLLEALPNIVERFPGARLILVGDGKTHAELVALAERLGVMQSVDFAGHVADRGQLVRLIDTAWVYAMPSRTEGMPRALIEAMSRGKPCVGAAVGGIPELLSGPQLVPSQDVGALASAINNLLGDAKLRQGLGFRNERRVVAYQPQEMEARARQWTSLVESLRPIRTSRRPD